MDRDIMFSRIIGFISKVHGIEVTFKDIKVGELTNLQQEMLLILYLSCSYTLSGLSECLNINLPNCSREVKKLTESGYVQKSISTVDKRKTELQLTTFGSEQVEQYLYTIKESFYKSRTDFNDDKIDRIISAIDLLEQEVFN